MRAETKKLSRVVDESSDIHTGGKSRIGVHGRITGRRQD